jgi:hypothetical protein
MSAIRPSPRDKSPCIHGRSATKTGNQCDINVTGVMGVLLMRRRIKMLGTGKAGQVHWQHHRHGRVSDAGRPGQRRNQLTGRAAGHRDRVMLLGAPG